jgi:hypothetical protein
MSEEYGYWWHESDASSFEVYVTHDNGIRICVESVYTSEIARALAQALFAAADYSEAQEQK